jgi:hypothetical protein
MLYLLRYVVLVLILMPRLFSSNLMRLHNTASMPKYSGGTIPNPSYLFTCCAMIDPEYAVIRAMEVIWETSS